MLRLPLLATLRVTSRRELADWAFAALLFATVARLAVPATFKQLHHSTAIMELLLLMAAKDLAHAQQAEQCLRGGSTVRARVIALLPPGMTGILRLNRQLWLSCLPRLRGRQMPQTLAQGVAFTYFERGAYSTAGAAILTMVVSLPGTP